MSWGCCERMIRVRDLILTICSKNVLYFSIKKLLCLIKANGIVPNSICQMRLFCFHLLNYYEQCFTRIFVFSAAPLCPCCHPALCLVWQPVMLTWMMTQEAEMPHEFVNDSLSKGSEGKSAKRFSLWHQRRGPDIQLRPVCGTLVLLEWWMCWNLRGNMCLQVTFGQIHISPKRKAEKPAF